MLQQVRGKESQSLLELLDKAADHDESGAGAVFEHKLVGEQENQIENPMTERQHLSFN